MLCAVFLVPLFACHLLFLKTYWDGFQSIIGEGAWPGVYHSSASGLGLLLIEGILVSPWGSLAMLSYLSFTGILLLLMMRSFGRFG